MLFGQRLLPERSGRSLPSDLSRHAHTLVEQYRLNDGVFQLRVRSVPRMSVPRRVALTWQNTPGSAWSPSRQVMAQVEFGAQRLPLETS